MENRKKPKAKVIFINTIPCRLLEVESRDIFVGRVTSDLNSLISPSNNTQYTLKS